MAAVAKTDRPRPRALLALVGLTAYLIAIRGDPSKGDLYAFDSQTGRLRWHSQFKGIDPLLSVDGGIVRVDATVGSGCEPGHPVAARFDGRTGKATKEAHPPALPEGAPLAVSVNHGVVSVTGRPWKAHVNDRGQPVGAEATGYRFGYVYVAVGGTWGKPCNE